MAPRERRFVKPWWRFPWGGVTLFASGFLTGVAIVCGLYVYRELGAEFPGPYYREVIPAPSLAAVALTAIESEKPPLRFHRSDSAEVASVGYRGSEMCLLSPDGESVAYDLDSGEWFTIFIFRSGAKQRVPVATIRESDSGRAFDYAWTADSRALVIYGSGPVYGYRFDEDLLPLVWDVGEEKLYSAR